MSRRGVGGVWGGGVSLIYFLNEIKTNQSCRAVGRKQRYLFVLLSLFFPKFVWSRADGSDSFCRYSNIFYGTGLDFFFFPSIILFYFFRSIQIYICILYIKGVGGNDATSRSLTISSDCKVSLINTVQKMIAIIKHLIATPTLSSCKLDHPAAA